MRSFSLSLMFMHYQGRNLHLQWKLVLFAVWCKPRKGLCNGLASFRVDNILRALEAWAGRCILCILESK